MQNKKEKAYKLCKNAEPFYFKTNKKGKLVIFVHGFTDSPGSLKSQAELLHKMGVNCYGILLPGHGSHHADLSDFKPEDFFKHLEKEFLHKTEEYKKIYLVGLSLGGNLCLELAAKYPEKIFGVACIGTPIKVKGHGWIKPFAPIVLSFHKYWKRKYPSEAVRKRFVENGAYEYFPIKAVIQVIKYLEEMQHNLEKVKAPTIIFRPKNKNHTRTSSADYIFKNISSKNKKVVEIYDYYYPKSQERIFKKAVEFFGL